MQKNESNLPVQAACKCGQSFLIEKTLRTCRADGKRIFYSDQDDAGLCAFRCRACHSPVHESVPGAEYGRSLTPQSAEGDQSLAWSDLAAQAMVAITKDGFVDEACLTDGGTPQNDWIEQMRKEGFGVVKVDRPMAKAYLFETIPLDSTELGPKEYGRMIVARNETGEVEAAGWDCSSTRASAKGWLLRGLQLKFVPHQQICRLLKLTKAHVFATLTPVGETLSLAQAKQALVGY
jgi:hypothetical protein